MTTTLDIIKQEAERYGYEVADLLGHSRTPHVSNVRHYAVWRARNETKRSWGELARVFKRDHTTLISAYQKVEATTPGLRGVFGPRPAAPVEVKQKSLTYQGPPCRNGHDGTRYAATFRCVHCERERMKKQRASCGPVDAHV